jgi:hypothetical protein
MARSSNAFCVILVLAAGIAFAGTARADDDDDYRDFLKDCNVPGLPYEDAKSCLERARVLDEDRPSPQLQGVMARLEREIEATEDGTPPPTAPAAAPASAAPRSLLTPSASASRSSAKAVDRAASAATDSPDRDQLEADYEAAGRAVAEDVAPREPGIGDGSDAAVEHYAPHG